MTWLTHSTKCTSTVRSFNKRGLHNMVKEGMAKQNNDVEKVFRDIGLKKGDVVFVHANMLSFGLISRDKDKFVRFFLDPLLKVIGKTGTVACHTYTFSYGLHGTHYVHEKSPSRSPRSPPMAQRRDTSPITLPAPLPVWDLHSRGYTHSKQSVCILE